MNTQQQHQFLGVLADKLIADHLAPPATRYPDKAEDLQIGQDEDFQRDAQRWFNAVGTMGFYEAIDSADMAFAAFLYFTTENTGNFWKDMYCWLVEPVNDWLAGQDANHAA